MKKRPAERPLLVALLAIAGSIMAAAGQESAPASPAKPKVKAPPPPPEALAWMDELTVLPPGSFRDLPPVRTSFGLSWNNVFNAGEFVVSLNRSKESPQTLLVGVAEGRSNGLARALWPYDVEAEALVESRSLRPRLFEVAETERGRAFHYRLEFGKDRVNTRTVVRDVKPKAGVEPVISEKTYRYQSLHDVLSAVLYIRSQPLADGDVIRAIISPFNRPYHTEFEVLGRETRKIGREEYQAIKLGIEIRKINSDRTLQTYEKMKKATIWLSEDDFRLPLEVQADIFVGYISARMKEREWLDAPPAPGRVASLGSLPTGR